MPLFAVDLNVNNGMGPYRDPSAATTPHRAFGALQAQAPAWEPSQRRENEDSVWRKRRLAADRTKTAIANAMDIAPALTNALRGYIAMRGGSIQAQQLAEFYKSPACAGLEVPKGGALKLLQNVKNSGLKFTHLSHRNKWIITLDHDAQQSQINFKSSPPPDTIFQGTVKFFKNLRVRGAYGFIEVDHTDIEVFVSEKDAPYLYLMQGDRCEFKIVEDYKNRSRGTHQWKATDVVCILRAGMTPVVKPNVANSKALKVFAEIIVVIEENGGHLFAKNLPAIYESKYDRPLDLKAIGFVSMSALAPRIPGVSVRDGHDPDTTVLTTVVAPVTTQIPIQRAECAEESALSKDRDEAAAAVISAFIGEVISATRRDAASAALAEMTVEADVKAREQALREHENTPALAIDEVYDHDFPPLKSAAPVVASLNLVVSEAMCHVSLDPNRDESKMAQVPEGYTLVAAILQYLGEMRFFPTFQAQQIDDDVLPYLKQTDLVEIGVTPAVCLSVLNVANAIGNQNELVTPYGLHDVATHESILETKLLENSREKVRDDMCCIITCEIMNDPVICIGDGHTYERKAITGWFSTGARTSPTTNEPLDNITLIPNHAVRRLILTLQELYGTEETKSPY